MNGFSVPNAALLGKSNYDSDCRARRIRVSSGVLQLRAFCNYWLPVLAWMVLIFSASSDTHSYQHSSRILAPILHWLFPHISAMAVDRTVLLARKCAHLTVYAVLALLLWRALRKSLKNDRRGWSWREARLVLLLVALYAGTDEFHQLFVPSRTAHVTDVLIDTVGGAAGLLALWVVGRWRKYW